MLEDTAYDLMHDGLAPKHVSMKIGRKPTGHDEKMIADYFRKRNVSARGNQMRTPLKDKAGVPESGDGEKSASGGESGAAGKKKVRGAVEKKGGGEKEKRKEGNKKTEGQKKNKGRDRKRCSGKKKKQG